ncbi:MAG: hypothetical protein KIS91_01455 [Anaerolineae bacterium]|nr:hypothetical protein [Anaerolineae bacterium]
MKRPGTAPRAWLVAALVVVALVGGWVRAGAAWAGSPDAGDAPASQDTRPHGGPGAPPVTRFAGPSPSESARLGGPRRETPAPHPYEWLIPDSELVNGPTAADFDVRAFVKSYPGDLKSFSQEVEGQSRDGIELIEMIAHRYSVNPRLLLALLEWKGGWLTRTEIAEREQIYPFGFEVWWAKGFYKQMEWVANYLNAGFYSCAERGYCETWFQDGVRQPTPPEGLNSGSAGLSHFLARMVKQAEWDALRAPDGDFMQTYRRLFGDPWQRAYDGPLVPDGLTQPAMKLPWAAGETWWYTGAPHGGWGPGSAWGGIDFGPGDAPGTSERRQTGCFDATEYWVRAMVPGLVAVSDFGEVIQDLDGDGDVRTGWTLIYNHIAAQDRVDQGRWLRVGDAIGHPSCEGGWASGTHVHLARRYNGVWMSAMGSDSVPFTLSGWQPHSSGVEYQGTLTHDELPPRRAVPWRVNGQNDVESDNWPSR